MVIDFHSHIFPDSIAEKTIKLLADKAKLTPATDGTKAGLIESVRNAGADISVVLPVVTKPKQFNTVNSFAAEVNETGGLVSFGGIHPDSDNIEARLDEIVSLGLKGIKLHPDYQGIYIDDIRYARIISGAVERGLLVSVHAGVDLGFIEDVHCTPERTKHMLKLVYGNCRADVPKIILAHSGGLNMAQDVLEWLADENVMFDLAFTLVYAPIEETRKIIEAHGADRILFATDSPWGNLDESLRRLELLRLNGDELEKIKWKNAAHLLGMTEGDVKTKSVKDYSS